MTTSTPTVQPLQSLDEWDDFLKERYPEPATEGAVPGPGPASAYRATDPEKKKEEFRDYKADARPGVREFYRQNHSHQTLDFVLSAKKKWLAFGQREMGVWEAAEYLNSLVDDSDPDTDLSQLQHLLQTSEAIRRDGHPRWMILTGFIHDLGKILCLYGEPQWAVVGDTFPVGCAWSEKIVFPEYFAANTDRERPELQSTNGIYETGCGLDAVHLSWGHDEYIYQVAKPYMPEEGLYMLRYHSFYPWHREGAYEHLAHDHDRAMKKWVLLFNQYDLYTKSHQPPDVSQLKPYYTELIREFFPPTLRW